MYGDEGIFEVSVHDEVSVWQPNVIVVVDGVEEFIPALVRITQPRIVPLLLQQELHLVFLQQFRNRRTKIATTFRFAHSRLDGVWPTYQTGLIWRGQTQQQHANIDGECS